MNISLLLAQRQALLAQVRLANFAFAYARLGDFAVRIARAGLRGTVTPLMQVNRKTRVAPMIC